MKRWLLCIALAVGWLQQPARAQEQGDYGPDWPVCQNLNADPMVEIAACNRLIDGGSLARKHLSWAYNDRGTAWIDLERGDLAADDFQKSIATDPSNHAPYFNLAALYGHAGQSREAVALYDKGLALNPNAPPGAYCNRGKALEALGRFDDALESYLRELRPAPNDDCALYRITKLAEEKHREDIALAALDRALQTNPGDAESYHRRGDVYFELGQFERALSDLSEAVRLDPDDVRALRSRAYAYRELERYDAAIADLDNAVARAPEDVDGLLGRAQVYFLRREYRLAARDCKRRIEALPGDGACLALGWRIAMMLGQFDAASGYADALVAAHDDLYLLYRGAAQIASGDISGAAADFRRYTAAAPDDPYGWLWLYLADRELGRDDPTKLRELAARRDAWPIIVIRHMAGMASAEDVLAAVDVPDPKIKRLRLAEADYYLGKLASLAGDSKRAAALFEASVAVGHVEIDVTKFLPVYKTDDDLEVALATAALHDKGL